MNFFLKIVFLFFIGCELGWGDEEKLTTLNELKPFGLNQAINHLKVEKATGREQTE